MDANQHRSAEGQRIPVASLAHDLTDAVAEGQDTVGLRNRVLDMKPVEAVETLLWMLEELLYRDEIMTLTPAPGLHLQPLLARLLYALDRRAPQAVSNRALAAAMWRLDAADHDLKVIMVMISNLRKRLKESRLPATIETVRGIGYRLIRPDGLLEWDS